VVIFGSSPSGHAGEMHMPGVERKALKEVELIIPGLANIRIRDVIFQPGASTPMMTMENDMVCETTEGHLEGRTVRRIARSIMACSPSGEQYDGDTPGDARRRPRCSHRLRSPV
jgi:hypothetical protein